MEIELDSTMDSMEIEQLGEAKPFCLSEFDKGRLISLYEEKNEDGRRKYNNIQIASIIGCHRNTVTAIVKKYNVNGDVRNVIPEGKPEILNSHEKRLVLNIIRQEPLASLRYIKQEVKDTYGIGISKDTIRRLYNKNGLRSRRAARKTMLNEAQRKARLEFCETFRDFDADFWRGVIFSDESHIHLANNREPDFVWRTRGSRFSKKYTRKIRYREKRSIHIWSSFNYYNPGPLVTISGKLNSQKYVEVLRENLIPIVEGEFGGAAFFSMIMLLPI